MGECLVLSQEGAKKLETGCFVAPLLAMTGQKLTEREAPEVAALMEINHAATAGP